MSQQFPPFPTVHIVERRTNRILQEVTAGVQRVEWTERARRFAPGSLNIAADDLAQDALNEILAGNGAIHIAREWTETFPNGNEVLHVDEVWGPITSAVASDGSRLVVRHEFMPLRNEVVVLGSGEGAARNVERRTDAASQLLHGCREVVVDARQITTTTGLQNRGDVTLAKLGVTRTVQAGGARGGGFNWQLNFADNLVYLLWRHVDTDGVANVDGGGIVPAGEYIETIITDNLIAPTLSRRAIDVPAIAADGTGIGANLDLELRWDNLADAVEQACFGGDVSVYADVNAASQVEFGTRAINDRTASGFNTAIFGKSFQDAARYDIRPGDRVTLEEYFRQDSKLPDLSVDALCSARTVVSIPSRPDEITLEIGAEVAGLDDLLRAGDRRSTSARFV